MKGAYFPVWTKINKVIEKVEDAKIYRLEDGSLYARLNVCLDIGSEVAILDSETANGFEFSEKLSELTLKLNTITSSEIKNYQKQIVTFLWNRNRDPKP